ncbi:MAG TPA: histidine kinase dimerization/phosphoacceptor domain -containing protein [Aliidongia sp.]|uniref:histidine kinase dimerization/phosphoacceptor domain -containing protein n=1 Tax=Aliidongia sp. TaxID=1914230 RepID=UPI002DDCD190|nr:histidine kinase dimerization/phosphoacceptor domain -containing protein [Aliidongia sp.]HEV2677815.1 histidine kinase dimerization/phosphoacceptor domain -containing protein [Aliidongia sp.]
MASENPALSNVVDLDACDQEPIHVPGSIQPHGMMLVADSEWRRVRHVAGDIEGRLGVAAWEGQPLHLLIGERLSTLAGAMSEPGRAGGFIGRIGTSAGERLDVSAHFSAPYIVVELETAAAVDVPTSLVLDGLAAAATGFEQAASLAILCEKAAREFRRLTGFDRVMIYRFLDDGAGRVLAEDKRRDLHSFLNQHFPASDIPQQARALYVRNTIRVIPDVSYAPVALRPNAAAPLDMSDSSLRSVSPVHLQYLANMGVGASASISIVKDGSLWGLIACHHDTPRTLTYDARAACRSLAGNLARQIKAKKEAEGYRQRIRLRGFEDDIVALLSREGALDEVLSHHLSEIGRMMAADGIAVLRGCELVMHGICPGDGDVRALAAWLVARISEPVLSTDELSDIYPPAKAFQNAGSGMLGVTLSADEPWVLIWFRVEQIETVNWAGNPHKTTAASDAHGPLTPRASFEAWRETVRGRARNWVLPEVEAAKRLRAALLDIQQNRRVRELNRQLTVILSDKDLLLQQKDFLVGEVHHRVQNSLQLVSAFLNLQARASENPELHVALDEACRRLSAVGLVHRRLYRGDQIELVDVARYIEELCADTVSFMGEDWSQHLTLNLSPSIVSTDRAVTLGLVLTELLINSNKHAYDGAAGPIEIGLAEDRTHLHLIVADRGAGKASARKGFGSRIMDALVSQLRGTIAYTDNQPGLRIEVTVPMA